MALMRDVVEHQRRFFGEKPAICNKCLKKQFQLIPQDPELAALKQDFDAMVSAGMFYGEVPKFDEIVSKLRKLEKLLNT